MMQAGLQVWLLPRTGPPTGHSPASTSWCVPSLLPFVQTQLTSVDPLNWSLARGAEAGWRLGAEWAVWNPNVFYYLAHG